VNSYFLFICIIIQFTVKLGAKTVERFFSLADDNFVDDVNDDLKCFLSEQKGDRYVNNLIKLNLLALFSLVITYIIAVISSLRF
jgi:hypothetical protein